MKKTSVLGSGSWGFTLQILLALKGYEVLGWTSKQQLCEQVNLDRVHPLFPNTPIPGNIRLTTDLQEAITHQEMIVESVTSSGLRPVFEQIKHEKFNCPIVITSKGVEQSTLLTLPQVLIDVLGEGAREWIGILSGPSFAAEVIGLKPTSVVASSFNPALTTVISSAFNTPAFRVYPNSDIIGVSFGGAMKNVISIACAISDGLKFGVSARSALTTRGLHEMRKIAVACGGKADTVNGLSGMGDLIATSSSHLSRNYRYGEMLARGYSSDQALAEIGLVVEGAYSTVSFERLGKKLNIPLPITEAIYEIIYEGLPPIKAVQKLMQREVKEEHL